MSKETKNVRMPVDDEQVVILSVVTKFQIDDIARELQDTKGLTIESRERLKSHVKELEELSKEKKDQGYYAKVLRILKDSD